MSGATIKVLLIDDDEDDYVLTRDLFSLVKDGAYSLDWAPTYAEGLEIARRREHHVCLVDYRLAELNGLQFIREARSAGITTPMIVLTGLGDYELDVAAMKSGATDYLVKNETSPKRLERTIRYAVALNTERNSAEQILRQSEARFRRIVESNVMGIFFSDLEGEIVEANAAFLEMVGYTSEDLTAGRMDWKEMTPPEYRELDARALRQLAASGVCDSYEKEYIRKDGRRISIVLSVATFEEAKQSGVAFVLDISERRMLEEQLRQSQKLESVGLLAGGVAHDFNNLLTVITGYSELTLKGLDRSDVVTNNIEEIRKASEKATSLTRQLLAFSRKQLLQPKVLALDSVILDIEKMLGRLIGEDLELCTAPGVGVGHVKADPGQIEQVILNLVINARDAMPDGGRITIETANVYLDDAYARLHVTVQPGWYVMLAVSDTGHGMDAEVQKYIFEPFFTTKKPGNGTGLGLSTVYGIVRQSGGNVWVYSEVNVGTTIKVYLPLVDEEVESDSPRSSSAETGGTETILLAEDDEMVRNLTQKSLRTYGYTVLEAANASEALSISQEHQGPIHLLLTDIVMPGMSGNNLADEVVKFRPATRVLYMSGYTDRAIVHHGILDKHIAFIGKPFTPDALALKVREALSNDRK